MIGRATKLISARAQHHEQDDSKKEVTATLSPLESTGKPIALGNIAMEFIDLHLASLFRTDLLLRAFRLSSTDLTGTGCGY
jgi:hypothetical protein